MKMNAILEQLKITSTLRLFIYVVMIVVFNEIISDWGNFKAGLMGVAPL